VAAITYHGIEIRALNIGINFRDVIECALLKIIKIISRTTSSHNL
jgi:hypothetical protein